MKKIALAFEITVISLLFGGSISAKDIPGLGYWTELSAEVLIATALILLFAGIAERIKK